MFDTRAVVPAPIENNDLTGGRKMRHVSLDIHLRLFAVRGRRKRHHTKDTRTDAFGQRFDGAALARGVTAFEYDDGSQALGLDPFLEVTQLDLELVQLLFIE